MKPYGEPVWLLNKPRRKRVLLVLASKPVSQQLGRETAKEAQSEFDKSAAHLV
jgi:hypothetical protein